MAPYIFFLLWTGAYNTALVWLGAAAVTDLLDGFLARRLDASSRIGGYLDPVADKVLLGGSFLVLALTGAIPWWLATIVLGRDVLLLSGAALALHRDLSPSIWGKWSTFAQILYVLAVVARAPVTAMGWVVAGLAVISGGHYALRLFSRHE